MNIGERINSYGTSGRNGGILYHRNECINSEVGASLSQYNSNDYNQLILPYMAFAVSEVIQTNTHNDSIGDSIGDLESLY
jgi:hypothetical protein